MGVRPRSRPATTAAAVSGRRRVVHALVATIVAGAVSAPAPAVAAPTAGSEPVAAATARQAIVTTPTTTATTTPTTAPTTVSPTSGQPPAPPTVSPTSGPPPTTTTTTPPPPPESTYLVGDSITDMNRAVIAPVLADCGAEVHLHSLSARRIEQGYEWNGGWVNSGLDEMDRILQQADPTTWIIELGSNDLQDIAAPEEAHRLIRTVLDRIDDGDRVLWTTVLWPHYATATDIFNAALAATPGIELVEWHAVGGGHLADPVHPTDDGARLLASLYCNAIA